MRTTPRPSLRTLLLAGVLAASPLPALAQATDQEAARLQAIGEIYFGKPAAGEAPVYKVVPEGDHYRASLDLELMVRRFLAQLPQEKVAGVSFQWPAPSLALVSRGDGTWRYWDYRIPKLAFEADGQRAEVSTDGVDFEAIADPVTGVTPSMKGRFARVTASSSVKKSDDPMVVTSENVSSDVVLEGTATATATPGVVDSTLRQTTAAMSYSVDIAGGMSGGVPDMKFSLQGGRQEQDTGIRGMRYAAILDLWAHLVAHHEPQDFAAGQGALKTKIAAALPIFEAATQKIAGTDFAFESPFGIAKAEKAAIDVDLAGLTREGRFAMAIGFTGLQAYSLFMPKWAQKLVPAELALTGRVTGYDLATPMSAFLDAADFSRDKPLTSEQEARIAALFLPKGAVEVVVDGNRFANALYDIALDGRLTAGPAGAKGAVTVRAKGIDKVADHLAKAEQDDESRALAGMIAAARQFAERKGDDLVWRFDFDGDAVAVNGKPLK